VRLDRRLLDDELCVRQPARDEPEHLALARVSASRPASHGLPAGRVRARRSITVRVTDGDSSESPAAIACTAAIRSSGRARFSGNPDAPACSAPKTAGRAKPGQSYV
jgi:hypothetical protein